MLACGVDHTYPAGHADLFAAIAADGLVISEWPPGSRPTRLRFLARNRVIAVPGPVTSSKSAGCHELTRTRYATCIITPEHIIEAVAAEDIRSAINRQMVLRSAL